MTQNPYLQQDATPVEFLEAERTVIVDHATGETTVIGGRLERVLIDPTTGRQQREITHLVAASADGSHLLFPYQRPLAVCACCGAQPLAQPFLCVQCNRPLCASCRIVDGAVTLCRDCGTTTWFQRLIKWLKAI